MPSVKITSTVEEELGKPKGRDNLLGVSEMTNQILWRQLLAEVLGTFLLVAIGVASIVIIRMPGTAVTIGLTFGLTAGAVILMIGHVSGGHINPAVSLGLLAAGHIGLLRVLCYVVAQMVGAVAGAALIKALVPETNLGSLGMTTVTEGLSAPEAMVLEALVTFVLVGVVCAVCDSGRTDIGGSAPLAIGLWIAGAHMAVMHMTGASMNPARSFGPAAIMNIWDDHWVYWVGPIVGGVCAGISYRLLFSGSVLRKEV